MKNTPDFTAINIDPCITSDWDAGFGWFDVPSRNTPSPDSPTLPRLYIHRHLAWGPLVNSEDHHPLFLDRTRLYLLLWITGHQFTAPNPREGVPITPPPNLSPQELRVAEAALIETGYIRRDDRDGQPHFRLTGKLSLSNSPSAHPETDLLLTLNQAYWTTLSSDLYRMAFILWVGLNTRISNGLRFVEFSLRGIPGMTKHQVTCVYHALCTDQLLKDLDRSESQMFDCRPQRSPSPGRKHVGLGKVALIRRHSFTNTPISPFPDPQPTNPNIRYVYRGPRRPPLVVRHKPGVEYVCRGNRRMEAR